MLLLLFLFFLLPIRAQRGCQTCRCSNTAQSQQQQKVTLTKRTYRKLRHVYEQLLVQVGLLLDAEDRRQRETCTSDKQPHPMSVRVAVMNSLFMPLSLSACI